MLLIRYTLTKPWSVVRIPLLFKKSINVEVYYGMGLGKTAAAEKIQAGRSAAVGR